MALNVEQITNRLAQMPDAALQKYAALNKNDPYIMALAVSESNRRKQMRQAAQAQQGMQPQPKVVDQAVQGMAAPMPESVGIGQLPAGNMNFADGGLVAFADGGEVERYQSGGAIAPALVEQYKREAQEMGEGRRMQFSPELKPVIEQLQAPRRTAEQSLLQREQAQMLQGPALFDRSNLPTPAAQPKVAPTAPTAQIPSPRDDSFRRQPDPRMLGTPAVPPGTPLQDGRTTLRPTSAQATPGTPTPTAPGTPTAFGAPADTGLDALAKRYFGPLEQDVGALRNQRTELVAGIKDLAAQNMADTQAAIDKRGDVFKGREERLTKREGELAGMKDKTFGLALLQAGAAMMSTPGNLGVALGKGIDVGSRQYMAGIDKLNAAKERLADARERLEDLRINRDDMNDREIRAAQREIRNAELKGKELIYSGLVSDMGMKRDDVKTMFSAAANALNTDKEIAARERISKADIAARERIAQLPGAQERLASLLGNGDIEKGLLRFAEIQAGKFNPTTAYTEYLSKRKEGDSVLTPQEFVTQIKSIQALMSNTPPTPSSKPTGKAFD